MPKQRTPAQQEAARRNGAKSRGPVSAQGKANSSRNRTTHGLLARTVVIRGEDPGRFTQLLNSLQAQIQPANYLEESLVEDLATARWRQRRFLGMETTAYCDEISRLLTQPNPADTNAGRAVQALNTLVPSHTLDYINRYELRFTRQLKRTLDTIKTLRACTGSAPVPEPGKTSILDSNPAIK